MSRPKLPDDQKIAGHITLGFTAQQLQKVRIQSALDGMDAREWCTKLILDTVNAEDTGPHLAAVPGEED